jgi:hypothetical protein
MKITNSNIHNSTGNSKEEKNTGKASRDVMRKINLQRFSASHKNSCIKERNRNLR